MYPCGDHQIPIMVIVLLSIESLFLVLFYRPQKISKSFMNDFNHFYKLKLKINKTLTYIL